MTDDRRPPQWELDMMIDVAERWGITPDEAEEFLEEIGAFGPKEDWPSEKDD